MKDLRLYEKHNGSNPVEYGFGREWVAMAMYMDDYPRFYNEDDAVLYWFRTVREEDVLDWYHNDYKKYMEEQYANNKAADDPDQLDEPGSDPGDEADGSGEEAEGEAGERSGEAEDEESADVGDRLRRDDYYWRGLAEYWEA